jgi:5-dehydro-2-deoxygluconokinase
MGDMDDRSLDFIGLGRAAVDLYGDQIGGRLEDMASFNKYIGGSPTNTAIGGTRLGLRTAVIARVGNEHMGRFVREALAAEGVDVSHVITDPDRLTALAILGIRDRDTFPLVFYRENCADMALSPDDFEPEFIASAKALVTSGTHFSTQHVYATSRTAMVMAKAAGTRVVLNIDYRPVLWGLTPPGMGENRFVPDATVTKHLQSIIADCDLIVGTDEEIHIAGGTTDTLGALAAIRSLSDATIVLKRGPMGCVVFPGEIPDQIEKGIVGRGFPVEVFNVLGAGDAFMGGFLRGWLRDEPLDVCCTYANACGAIVVSRHACSPASPSWTELSDYLETGSSHYRLREDACLNHIHWATNRRHDWPEVRALAFDHRAQFEEITDRLGIERNRIVAFKSLIGRALETADDGTPGTGALIDGTYGEDVLARLTGSGRWLARPVEIPGSRPLAFEAGGNVALRLRQWPIEHVVKCLVYLHPDDEAALMEEQLDKLSTLYEATRMTRHELMLEVILPKDLPVQTDTAARALEIIYGAGILPDWWKLQSPPRPGGWQAIGNAIERNDPYCRGVLLLGLDAPMAELGHAFAEARRQKWCKGFAIGRSIFRHAAEEWLAGNIDDQTAIESMAENYRRMVALWRSGGTDAA